MEAGRRTRSCSGRLPTRRCSSGRARTLAAHARRDGHAVGAGDRLPDRRRHRRPAVLRDGDVVGAELPLDVARLRVEQARRERGEARDQREADHQRRGRGRGACPGSARRSRVRGVRRRRRVEPPARADNGRDAARRAATRSSRRRRRAPATPATIAPRARRPTSPWTKRPNPIDAAARAMSPATRRQRDRGEPSSSARTRLRVPPRSAAPRSPATRAGARRARHDVPSTSEISTVRGATTIPRAADRAPRR